MFRSTFSGNWTHVHTLHPPLSAIHLHKANLRSSVYVPPLCNLTLEWFLRMCLNSCVMCWLRNCNYTGNNTESEVDMKRPKGWRLFIVKICFDYLNIFYIIDSLNYIHILVFYVSSLSPFSDNSPDSPKLSTKLVRNSPRSGSVQMRKMAALTSSPRQTSPSRPSSLPVCSPCSSPSHPIPVPSQVRAYEQIQRSMGGSPSSPPSARVCSSPKVSRGAYCVCVLVM